jgi:hypothetical protein
MCWALNHQNIIEMAQMHISLLEFLIKENKKHVKVKNAYAQEIEKNENLTKELSICHDTISNLRIENGNLLAKVEKSNDCHDSIVNLKINEHEIENEKFKFARSMLYNGRRTGIKDDIGFQ